MRSWNAMQNKYMTYMLNTSTSIFYLRTPAILNRHRENAPVSTNFGLADFDNMSRMLLISLESNLPFPSFILPRYIGTKSSKGRRHVERSVLGTNEDDQYTPLCSLAVVRIPTFHVQFVCCIASIQRPTYNDRSRVGDWAVSIEETDVDEYTIADWLEPPMTRSSRARNWLAATELEEK